MTHNKGREMINTNKSLNVKFEANKNTGTASVYIPFPVKEIHVKGVDIDWEADYYGVTFQSSIVDYGTVGSGFCGILCDVATSLKQLRYIFVNPRDINGTYTFTYTPIDTSKAISVNYGNVVFTLEFVGYV